MAWHLTPRNLYFVEDDDMASYSTESLFHETDDVVPNSAESLFHNDDVASDSLKFVSRGGANVTFHYA